MMKKLIKIIFLFITVPSIAQVGIGVSISSPSEALDIEDNDPVKTVLSLDNDSSGDVYINFQLLDSTRFSFGIDDSDSDLLKLGGTDINTGEYLYFNASGYLGIQDTTPAYPLELPGDINIVDQDNQIYRIGNEHVLSIRNTNNLYMGEEAGNQNNVGGMNNTLLGFRSGYSNTTADALVFIGNQSGNNNTTGGNNINIGYQAGFSNSSGSGRIVIGYQAAYGNTTSNAMFIDNSSTSVPLMRGYFDTDTLAINGGLIVNEQSGDFDFRVESASNDHMLFVDASTDQVFINGNTSHTIQGMVPKMHMAGTNDATGTINIVQHSNSATGNLLQFSKSRGSDASPTVISDDDLLGIIKFAAYDGTDYASQVAIIEARTDNDFAIGANDLPTELIFQTVEDGGTAASVNLVIKADGNVGINRSLPQSIVDINGSFGRVVSEISADGSVDSTHNVIKGNTSAGDVTITLPAVSNATNRIYTFIKTAAANTLTIDGDGAETINGNASLAYTNQYSRLTIVSNGTEWFIMHEDATP
jgi:hypothetical protein